MSKRSNACEFSSKERQVIYDRDKWCIFCRMGYDPNEFEAGYGLQVCHIIPRSQGGLGIRQNGVLGCMYHHQIMDNGNDSRRDEMLEIAKEYLKGFYPDWDEKSLIYSKWSWAEMSQNDKGE